MPSSQEQIKAAQEKVKAFVRAGDYDGAIAILRALDHPKKADWIAQIEKRKSDNEFESALNELPARPSGTTPTRAASLPTAPPVNIGIERTFRWVWGILTLLACGWIVMGVTSTQRAVNTVNATPMNTTGMTAEQAENAEALMDASVAVIGGGLGLAFFLCTGVPFFLLFLLLYWRNGVSIANKRRHAETIGALRGG